jgi:hypothetical protein
MTESLLAHATLQLPANIMVIGLMVPLLRIVFFIEKTLDLNCFQFVNITDYYSKRFIGYPSIVLANVALFWAVQCIICIDCQLRNNVGSYFPCYDVKSITLLY